MRSPWAAPTAHRTTTGTRAAPDGTLTELRPYLADVLGADVLGADVLGADVFWNGPRRAVRGVSRSGVGARTYFFAGS